MSLLLKPNLPEVFSSDEIFQKFVDEQCKHLADGTSRKVYSVCGGEYVVKVAIDQTKTICNWLEISAFLKFESDRFKLADVVSWSMSGKFLVMEKIDIQSKPNDGFDYPAWVTDRKCSNIGKSLNGKYKICDYALIKSLGGAHESEFA